MEAVTEKIDDLVEITSVDPAKAWSIVKTANGSYYTPFKRFKRRKTYETIKEGDKPNVKEIVEYLNDTKNQTKSVYNWAHWIFSKEKSIKIDDKNLVILPSGAYRYNPADKVNPERLVPFTLRKDESVELKTTTGKVKSDIHNFLENEKIYKDLNIIYKMGILMYGEPGNGKTSVIRSVLNSGQFEDAVLIFVGALMPTIAFFQEISKTLPDRMKVFVFEELSLTTKYANPEEMLSFLDGEASTDRSILLATTNYPELLPGNIVDRPSRFDKLYNFANPTLEERRELMAFFLRTVEVKQADLTSTEGLSVAAVKEVCLSSLLNGVSIESAAAELKKRSQKFKKQFKDHKSSMGFGVEKQAAPAGF